MLSYDSHLWYIAACAFLVAFVSIVFVAHLKQVLHCLAITHMFVLISCRTRCMMMATIHLVCLVVSIIFVGAGDSGKQLIINAFTQQQQHSFHGLILCSLL